MVTHWHRLSREVVNAPSLEVFKAMLDGAWSNLVHLKVSMSTAGGLELMIFKIPFQPKPFYDYLSSPLSVHVVWFAKPLGYLYENVLYLVSRNQEHCASSLYAGISQIKSLATITPEKIKNNNLGALSLSLAVSQKHLESVDSNNI